MGEEGEQAITTALRLMAAYGAGDWDEVYSIAYAMCRAGVVLHNAGRGHDGAFLTTCGISFIEARNAGDWSTIFQGIASMETVIRARYGSYITQDYEKALAASMHESPPLDQ